MTEDEPELRIVTPNMSVDVVNRYTAEAVLPVIDDVLTQYLGKSTSAQPARELQEKVRYRAECPDCGYEWSRKAVDDTQAICPECENRWYHDVPGHERPDAEIVPPGQ